MTTCNGAVVSKPGACKVEKASLTKILFGITVQVFVNDSNKSKFDSGGNQEETEFW
jgi:hypothetical protein